METRYLIPSYAQYEETKIFNCIMDRIDSRENNGYKSIVIPLKYYNGLTKEKFKEYNYLVVVNKKKVTVSWQNFDVIRTKNIIPKALCFLSLKRV